MATTRQGLTLEEFLALPEEKPALEYRRARLRSRRPSVVHLPQDRAEFLGPFSHGSRAGRLL